MNRTPLTLLGLIAAAALLAASCGGDHDHDAFNLGHACGHMSERATTLDGPADPDAERATISRTHTLYEISLGQDTDGDTLGHVSLSIDSAGRYAIFHDRTVDARVLAPSGEAVPTIDRVTPVAGCDRIAQFQVHDLGVGTYTLRLADAADATVQVLVERAEGYTPGD